MGFTELVPERCSPSFYHQKIEEWTRQAAILEYKTAQREEIWNNRVKSKRNAELEIGENCIEGGRKDGGEPAGVKTDWTPLDGQQSSSGVLW